MMKATIFNSIGFRIISAYVILSLLTLSFVVSIIFENQADLISKNTALEAEKQLSSLINSMKKFTLEMKRGTLFNIRDDRDIRNRIKEIITPHVTDYIIFTENGEVLEKSKRDLEPPKTYIQDGLRSITALTFTGREYYLRVDETNKMIYFYIPLQTFQSASAVLLTRKDISGTEESLRNLYRQAVFVIIVVLIFNLIFALVLYRFIIVPVKIIDGAGSKLLGGDLSARVKLQRSDDFGSLAGTFNSMAESLEKSVLALSKEKETALADRDYIKRLSLHDELTGLCSPNYITERIDEEMKGESTKRGGLAFFLIDIDNFESINNIYGYQTGDIVLKETAKSINQACNGSGVIARFGGEEFAVLAPKQTLKRARALAEGVRKAVEKRMIITPDGELSVRVSVGVSYIDHESLRLMKAGNEITEQAKSALLKAKANGKNRVEIY